MSNELNIRERLDDFWVFPKLSKVKDSRDFSDDFFIFLEQPDQKKTETNLYIHIPFCDSGCLFCPYYKIHGIPGYKKNISSYLNSVINELEKYASTPYFRSKEIASVHFGGGNPFLMSLTELGSLVNAIKSLFNVKVDFNWSSEGSIHSITSEEYVKGLMDLGISRISFGIQTFNPTIRQKTKMRTKIDEIQRGVEILHKAGLYEYCVDMMYNMPDQTMDDLYADLEQVTGLDPLHVDIYNMALFPNTDLDTLLKTADYFKIKPSNENQISMYKAAVKWLKEHGYSQLTTSSYSRKQKRQHITDFLYLSNTNVLGIGASSRGYLDGYSYRNVCSIEEYHKQLNSGNYPADLSHKASEEEQADRTMIFFPITLSIEKKRIPDFQRYASKIDAIVNMGLAKWVDDVLVITDEGMVWSGNISTYFIGDERWNTYMKAFFNSIKDKTNPYNEDYIGINTESLGEK
jgi:coproporphyrinogen III oxidase-like Fe-S oxidoreductase